VEVLWKVVDPTIPLDFLLLPETPGPVPLFTPPMHAAVVEHVVMAKALTPAAIALKSEATRTAEIAKAATRKTRLTM
jgi:hypothetical protein